MKQEIRISGSGGQGIILTSVILGTAASIYEHYYCIQTQAYGPEARGGASKSDVIISDFPIMYPKARKLDYLVALTQSAANKFLPFCKEGSIVIIDSDFINIEETDKYKIYKLPLTSITMRELGKIITLNIVTLGALAKVCSFLKADSAKKAINDRVPNGTEELNLKAFEIGYNLI